MQDINIAESEIRIWKLIVNKMSCFISMREITLIQNSASFPYPLKLISHLET